MTENQNLRQMLRSLAGFIGDGMGGVLPKLGWDMNDFNTFVNKGETDTAWEGYQARKKLAESSKHRASAGPSTLPALQPQKRPAEDVNPSSRGAKKSRNEDVDSRASANGFNMLPMGAGTNLFPSEQDRHSGVFNDLMRGPGQPPMFSQSAGPSSSSLAYGGMSGNMGGYSNAYLGMPLNHQAMGQTNYDSSNAASPQSRVPPQVAPHDDEELEDDVNKSEAYKLLQSVLAFSCRSETDSSLADITWKIISAIQGIAYHRPSGLPTFKGDVECWKV